MESLSRVSTEQIYSKTERIGSDANPFQNYVLDAQYPWLDMATAKLHVKIGGNTGSSQLIALRGGLKQFIKNARLRINGVLVSDEKDVFKRFFLEDALKTQDDVVDEQLTTSLTNINSNRVKNAKFKIIEGQDFQLQPLDKPVALADGNHDVYLSETMTAKPDTDLQANITVAGGLITSVNSTTFPAQGYAEYDYPLKTFHVIEVP